MKVTIIYNGFQVASGVTNQIERLSEEFSKRNVIVKLLKNNQVLAYIDGKDIKNIVGETDLIVYLDKDRYIARMLEKSGYKLVNNVKALELCDDKMLTHITLANNDIKMPLTIPAPLCFHDDGNREFLNIIKEKLSFPMIVKENYGSLGRQVYLVNNDDELRETYEKLIHVNHLYQEFISSSKGKDYRLIVIGHKVVAYMKRENKHSYLSNLASGGTSSKVELPNEYLDMAIKASEILDLDYCGVDILEGSNGEPILSEVNSNAFFEGIEKTTHINVAGKYVEYILNTYGGGQNE